MILDFNSASGQDHLPGLDNDARLDRVRRDDGYHTPAIATIKQAADCIEIFREFWPDHYRQIGNCRCPWHKDEKSSLQITKNLAFCHACGFKYDAIDLYSKATNTTTSEAIKALSQKYNLIPENGKNKPTLKPKIIKTYDYTDPEGNLVFQVVRYEPKDFRQRRPDAAGGWAWNMKDVERIPYRLPDLLRAETVYIVEGEKDADRLRLLGLTATTSPGGAGKWLPSFTHFFKGKNVVIIPDNDEPGKKHADNIAKMLLEGSAASVKVVSLNGLGSKEDVSDWLDKGNLPEKLFQIVKDAPKYQEPEDSEPCLSDAILEADSFCQLDIPEKEVFLHPWLTEQQIFLITAWRGVGKSGFVLGILDALTKGTNFGPWACENSPNALYLDGEMACQDVMRRLRDLGTGQRKSKLFIYSDAYAHVLGLPKANLMDERWREGIREWMLANKVRIWVIDNLASLSTGDENSKQDWDPIDKFLVSLRHDGISTGIIHHVGKGGDQRGTSAKEDHADITIALKRPSDYKAEQGARFLATFTKGRIPIEHLHLMDDTEFQMVKVVGDTCEWSWKKISADAKRQVLKSLDSGMSASDVATLFELSKRHVFRIRSQAIKEGLLTEKNDLTPNGFQFVQESDNA